MVIMHDLRIYDAGYFGHLQVQAPVYHDNKQYVAEKGRMRSRP